MPSTHTSLHYHLIFATKHREPILAKEWRHELHSYLGGIVNGLDAHSEGVGGVADHVHLLVPESNYLSLRLHAGAEKIVVELDTRVEMFQLPLAGRIRRIHRQRLRTSLSPHVYCKSGGTPSGEILLRGVDRLPGEIRRCLRSSLPRLTSQPTLASRWDANLFPFPHPVVSLVPPVVSLRSTTGYRLRSRWDHDGSSVFGHHLVGFNKMIAVGHSENVAELLEA